MNKYFRDKETLEIVIIIIVIIVLTVIFTRVVSWLIQRSYVAASKKLKVDATRYRFLKHATTMVIWLMSLGAIVSFIPALRAMAVTLFAGAGILVALMGFAAQQAFSNIVSGIFIVIFRPFRVGDKITVGSLQSGIVEDITLRHTVIINFENKRIIIPNSVISTDVIINDSIGDAKICRWVEVGISYDSNIAMAIEIIQEIAMNHPFSIDNRSPEQIANGDPIVEVRVTQLGEYSINLKAYVWTDDPMLAHQMHCDINHSLKLKFDEKGIEIPFPYRTIVYKNDLPPNTPTKQ